MYCNAACFESFSIAAPQEIAASSPSVACQCALCWRDSFPPETIDQPRKKTRARCVQGRDGLRLPVSMALGRMTASGTHCQCSMELRQLRESLLFVACSPLANFNRFPALKIVGRGVHCSVTFRFWLRPPSDSIRVHLRVCKSCRTGFCYVLLITILLLITVTPLGGYPYQFRNSRCRGNSLARSASPPPLLNQLATNNRCGGC